MREGRAAPPGATVSTDAAGGVLPAGTGDAAHDWRVSPKLAFRRWAAGHANRGRGFGHRSMTVYCSMWDRFVDATGGVGPFVNEDGLRRFIGTVHARDYPSVANAAQQLRYLALIASVQSYLVSIGLLGTSNAMRLRHRIRSPDERRLPAALRPLQESALRRAIDERGTSDWRDVRDRALLELVLGCGLKVSEVQALTIDDLHLTETRPAVTVAGRRVVPLARSAVESLACWARLRPSLDPVSRMLFISGKSASPVLSVAQIYRLVSDIFKRAGLDTAQRGPQVLRNTFATRQLRSGTPLGVVSQWLGHADPESTAIYQRLVADSAGYEPV